MDIRLCTSPPTRQHHHQAAAAVVTAVPSTPPPPQPHGSEYILQVARCYCTQCTAPKGVCDRVMCNTHTRSLWYKLNESFRRINMHNCASPTHIHIHRWRWRRRQHAAAATCRWHPWGWGRFGVSRCHESACLTPP